MTPISSERDAAISILELELGFTDAASKATDELWQIIFKNTECYASQFTDNILNDGTDWKRINNGIKYSKSIGQLKNIYNRHPKLQEHKPFLDCLTARKKKLLHSQSK